MSRVCKNLKIQNNYLDQIDARNQVEKSLFRDIFADYMQIMNEVGENNDKLKVIERENY